MGPTFHRFRSDLDLILSFLHLINIFSAPAVCRPWAQYQDPVMSRDLVPALKSLDSSETDGCQVTNGTDHCNCAK